MADSTSSRARMTRDIGPDRRPRGRLWLHQRLRPASLTGLISRAPARTRPRKHSSSRMSERERIERAAAEVFGFDQLRPGQAEAVEHVLAGRDTLAVMSTGYGKSAIYQIAALLIPGSTVVVSPLIALQSDQVEDLEREQAGGAAAVSSFVPAGGRGGGVGGLAAGRA